ncbi:MAG: gamma-glutamyl-gamma-aminobutyrate hydrolase family protein [Butyrivibrio sp.]|nr:gamma-glutamyl-gamma-aminobutyrate hydrolase family protein [Acetatifactor muris]MCM1560096.1 gamma-glutamyl-gamma-aminobutyrate hydrolase family protein [Butyrivibrio sp.]
MKIAIAGKKAATENYVRYVADSGIEPLVTLNLGEIAGCDALILPGGGDITPAFFGERNRASRNIDTELDVLQFQAFDLCLRNKMPILGICKGMQVINVGLGGTVIQDLPTAGFHKYNDGDQYHPTVIEKESWLYPLCGGEAVINSAHHQSVGRPGAGLKIIQYCPLDRCPEAIAHESLPILGVQWHPERLDPQKATLSGGAVLACFVSLLVKQRQTAP